MNDLDELMTKPVLELTTQDIDTIIAYHRRQRARKAAGEKVTKPKIDLTSILGPVVAQAKPTPAPFKRRI